ncbi:MAG TPA: FHA domain-containing protein [Gemmatimonadaceae bacterium]|nr:FHA domain-containing protein [Gemmatimonadaceae bacterium]
MNRILEAVTNLSTLTIILIAAAAVLLLFVVWTMRRRRVDLYRDDLPPLIFAVHDRVRAPPDMRPAAFGNRTGYQAPEQWGEGAAPPYYPPAQPMAPPPASQQPGAAPPPSGAQSGESTANGGGGRDGNGNGQHGRASESTMRVPRYEGPVTMAFLPGRLVVQTAGRTGPRPGEEIRFPARKQGDGIVILGRDDGPSGATVKVPAESVSRRHARLQFENGRWKITNLSRTNPTLVNGEELMVAEGARWLRDGDIIEMGEMVFRFHER